MSKYSTENVTMSLEEKYKSWKANLTPDDVAMLQLGAVGSRSLDVAWRKQYVNTHINYLKSWIKYATKQDYFGYHTRKSLYLCQRTATVKFY